ncbi:MAG: SGNH/GDSL hydrolase family protein [Lachnospiraceae bacterium]|nr:SGNH/GDSL hydrolase family protein [Lachnospiraceae bacterium]
MKTILCYGDSNTYGYNPMNGYRYPENVRWTGRLQRLLGGYYNVVEEGCNGRTTVYDDPLEGWKNGLGYLRPCLNSHKPVDFVIMMLGSNDLKETFHASAEEIANGAGKLVEVIQTFTMEKQGFEPKIILVSPPEIGEGIRTSPFYGQFCENAIGRSREFPSNYRRIADKYHCIFFNAAEYISPSEEDSLHLMPEAHKVFADELYRLIIKLDKEL